MARRKDKQAQKETQLEKTRKRIWGAKARLDKTLLGPLLRHVRLVECEGVENDPEIACVDPAQGVVWMNPHKRHDLGEPEWMFVLAHQLLHLGLGHGPGRMEREPKAWNLACEHAADNMLYALKIGKAPHDYEVDLAFASLSEDAIYEMLVGDKPALDAFKTYAGARRPDLVTRPASAATPAYGSASQTTSRYGYAKPRRDWETLLAEGIRAAVEDAVEEAAETLGEDAAEKRKVWRPGEAAKRWVLSEMPLLGAVAAHITILADETLCDRMDISIAAVDAYLGEIYFNPKWGLSASEVLFVYAHELLHAALLHHTRGRGRDPWLWNIACDFVINDWLIEMGVGKFPSLGLLYDPRLKGMSSDEVYDLLLREPGRSKNARGFRGALGDVLFESESRRIYRGDVSTLDDFYRRCLSAGMSVMGRGTLPAGLVEEIRSLWTPPVPWDVALARWMEAHVPALRDPLRTYARASRRQSSTPDIPRPARFVPQEWKDAHTFGVVLDTSGSMDRELLGRALGAIASYAEARDVDQVRLVLCDAAPYDRGFVAPADLRGVFAVTGRGGTVLQPAVSFLLRQGDFPADAPIMVITDGWCEEELPIPRDHCFLLPRKGWNEGAMILRTSAPVFRVLKEEHYDG